MVDLERDYSPSSRVGGSAEPFILDYERRSVEAATGLGDRVQVLPSGTRWVRARTGAPLLVFVHGGYWQALSAEASLFLAPGALACGWSYAAVDYTIAPAGTIRAMVGEVAAGLAELAAAGPHGSVVLAGHSAGAHLAAMVALVDRSPLPLARVVLLSGVFDLRPLVHTSVNEPLGLDGPGAAALSPTLLPVRSAVPTMVAWGDDDTDAFRAQGHTYAARLRDAGCMVREHERRGRHHFDIVDDLVDPAATIGGFTLEGRG